MLTLFLMLSLHAGNDTTNVMRGNITAIYALQPYLASSAQFRDPANADIIVASLELLSRQQHAFTQPGAEPTTAVLSVLFSKQVALAREDFSRGSLDSARLRLRSLTSACLGCHSRSPSVDREGARVPNDGSLSSGELAAFLAATRQFDTALSTWTAVLDNPSTSTLEAYDRAIALRAAVSVAVRVKDDPVLTLALIDRVKNRPEMPGMVHRATLDWSQEVVAWRDEKFVASTQTPGALFARAKALIETSHAAATVAPDDVHFISLLRATTYLNLALARDPKAKWRGEALYLLALAGGAALDPDLFELDRMFLEACVRENPHTPLAVKCIDRLADRTVYLYTVSGESRVPIDVASNLGDLRALAR